MAYPYHAGHAAGRICFEPWSHGISVMRAILTRWSELDITHAGSIFAIAGVAPSAWHFIKRTWHDISGWVSQFFLASVTVPGGDPLNRNIVQWIQANKSRHYRIFTGRSEVQRDNTDRAAALKKTRRPVQYYPHWISRWFWHERNFFIAIRAMDSFTTAISNPAYDGIGGEDLTISCFGRSADPIMKLIDLCREFADQQTQFFVIIYSRDRYGLSWQPKYRKPIRRLETVHFDDDVKQDLVADIRQYLDPKTQRLYQSRSMPYRRGYLFYGPPGTGKTSLTTALAGEFGLDLYEMKIPSVATDAELEQMFQEIPPQCIVLLEDIDAVWVDRSLSSADSGHSFTNDKSTCTLSGLLNVLDGVGSQEGRIVIMTTNKPELLDAALVRPGRVDMKVFLGNISQKSAEQMFVRMFAPELSVVSSLDIKQVQELASQFAKEIPEDTFTPSQLQGFFQLHLNSAADAASSIRPWVDKELAKSSEKDFELVSSERRVIA
ncbi:hypothetical protein DL762_007391 [Monosporascus cannonballus]|uniref:AAA+ ATPase domain-containing protein n=1 Tax=Monosporascus cannonballus TaxID=155416 RepID=A0ABY0GZR9_9PEZI|nr:hypothetical protein DL762_007391 [Monosporascus cannonballus]